MSAGLALITGAAGWLGAALVRALLQSPTGAAERAARRVRCLVLPGEDASRLGGLGQSVEIVAGDLRNAASLRRFFRRARGATLFHAAGVIHPRRSTREFFQVNAEGTRRALVLSESVGVRRFIYVSSNSPCGVNPHPDHVFDESARYRPWLGYGRSKMLAEQHVSAAEERGRLETVVIRPPWFYGPGQPDRQAAFFRMIRDGRLPVLGSGDNRRSMVYVDNLCQALLLLEKSARARGQTYWIADERPYTMNEIVDTIERVLARDFGVKVARRRIRLPAAVGAVAHAVDRALQGALLYSQKVHVLSELPETIACSIDKAKRELGYQPRVALEEGIRRSVAWMRAHGQSI